MLENSIFRDSSKSYYPIITTILGLVVFTVVSEVLFQIPNTNIGEIELGLPISMLIFFFIIGIPEERNLFILAVLSAVVSLVAAYLGLLIAYASMGLASFFVSNVDSVGLFAAGIFGLVIIVVICAAYLYGKKALGIFIFVSLVVAIIFSYIGLIPGYLESTYNYDAETINLFDRIISYIAMGIAFGLGTGIYNRTANS